MNIATSFGIEDVKSVSPVGLPAWAESLFISALVPQLSSSGAPILWAIEGDCSTATISEQFKDNAGHYHARYSASEHFQSLFEAALSETRVTIAESPLILDLGSGSGVNSIIPCLRLFPGACFIATDLSGELLAILSAHMGETGQTDQVVCVQMDAMSDHVAPGVFDLVTGAAILHHLESPLAGLKAAARALKPGGHAIFFEPFDGYCLLRLAYERILSESELRKETLHPDVDRILRACVLDTQVRSDPDPKSDMFRHLDDKWLFSRQSMVEMAAEAGFSEAKIVPHASSQDLYQQIAPIQLRLATGLDNLPLPEWAVAILRSFDDALPETYKRNAMLEGTIVLTKGPDTVSAIDRRSFQDNGFIVSALAVPKSKSPICL